MGVGILCKKFVNPKEEVLNEFLRTVSVFQIVGVTKPSYGYSETSEWSKGAVHIFVFYIDPERE